MKKIYGHLREIGRMLSPTAIVIRALGLGLFEWQRRTLFEYPLNDLTNVPIVEDDLCGNDERESSLIHQMEATSSTMWLVGEMESLKILFTMATGRKPSSWVMGIDEYQCLKKEIRSRLDCKQRLTFSEIIQFQGLPVHIKATPGVELIMDINTALHFKKVEHRERNYRETLT